MKHKMILIVSLVALLLLAVFGERSGQIHLHLDHRWRQ